MSTFSPDSFAGLQRIAQASEARDIERINNYLDSFKGRSREELVLIVRRYESRYVSGSLWKRIIFGKSNIFQRAEYESAKNVLESSETTRSTQ